MTAEEHAKAASRHLAYIEESVKKGYGPSAYISLNHYAIFAQAHATTALALKAVEK